MAHFRVRWHPENPRNNNSSYWYTLNGVITYASGLLKDWVGGDHVCLVRYLRRRNKEIVYLGPDLSQASARHSVSSCELTGEQTFEELNKC